MVSKIVFISKTKLLEIRLEIEIIKSKCLSPFSFLQKQYSLAII